MNTSNQEKKPSKPDTRTERRSGIDRRQIYDLDYFVNGGEERRSYMDRRKRMGSDDDE
jgi:hypothetical protein